MSNIKTMTKQINVKVVCTCGEEVREKEEKLEFILKKFCDDWTFDIAELHAEILTL